MDSISPSLDHLEVAHSNGNGVTLISSNSVLDNADISYINDSDYGVYAVGGSPTISNSNISNNRTGIFLVGTTATIENNVLDNNSYRPIMSSGDFSYFSGNSGSSNEKNGIYLNGNLTQDGGTRNLGANSLSYLIESGNVNVVANSTLNFLAGAVVKFGSNYKLINEGALNISGSAGSEVVFTSVENDNYGNQVYSSPSTPSIKRGEIDMNEGSTAVIDYGIFSFMKYALAYVGVAVPVDIGDTLFDNNDYGILGDSNQPVDRAENLIFVDNAVDSSVGLP